MLRRTPLKKRSETNRKVRTVMHGRMKPKVGAKANAAEKRHIARVASLPCLVSGQRPVTVHHVRGTIHGAQIPRSHKRVVPLAAEYHLIQSGPETSVERLGHKGFFERYGIDLLAEAERLWEESCER